MTKEELILKDHERLIIHTTNRVIRKFKKSRHISDYDDFVAEARIAAWKAIVSYKSDKQTKLSTYIARCIANRLKDLNKKAYRQSTPDLEFYGPEDFHYDQPIDPSVTNVGSLSSDELSILKKVMGGKPLKVIINECASIKDVSTEYARKKVIRCLHRIRQKLTLEETIRLVSI